MLFDQKNITALSENSLSIELNVFNSCHSVNSSSFPHSCDFNISEICTVPTVFSGTPNPPAGTFVAKSSTVIVNCNTGYSSNNQNIASYPCEQIVSCSSKHILHYLQSYFRNCHINVCQLAILHRATKTYGRYSSPSYKMDLKVYRNAQKVTFW